MKKYIRSIFLFFCFSLFSSFSFAAVIDALQGSGTTADAVKVFNKAVASNGGTVDGNAQTDFSSAGDFGKYRAKMYAESVKGKINIRIQVSIKEADIVHLFTVQKNVEMDIAKRINAAFIKAGYQDAVIEENKKE